MGIIIRLTLLRFKLLKLNMMWSSWAVAIIEYSSILREVIWNSWLFSGCIRSSWLKDILTWWAFWDDSEGTFGFFLRIGNKGNFWISLKRRKNGLLFAFARNTILGYSLAISDFEGKISFT